MKYSKEAINIYNGAFDEATARNHEYCTVEHLLYTSIFYEESALMLKECGVDLLRLKKIWKSISMIISLLFQI